MQVSPMTCALTAIAAVLSIPVVLFLSDVVRDALSARRRKAREEAWRSLKGPQR